MRRALRRSQERGPVFNERATPVLTHTFFWCEACEAVIRNVWSCGPKIGSIPLRSSKEAFTWLINHVDMAAQHTENDAAVNAM